MSAQTRERLFTVDEYHHMAHASILSEDDRIELLEGRIFEMSRIGSRHAGCVKRLTALLTERVGRRAVASVQDPIRLGKR